MKSKKCRKCGIVEKMLFYGNLKTIWFPPKLENCNVINNKSSDLKAYLSHQTHYEWQVTVTMKNGATEL